MTDFGLGNRKITDNFEVTLPSGRKTEFTRAKTHYIRYSLSLQKSDFANSPVALSQELDLLMQLRTLAEKEGFGQEFKWIDARAEEIKKSITDSKIETFANAYYQPFFATPTEKQKEEMLNADNDLMKLLNSCKISETEFDPNAEIILNAYKDKTKDLYHLGYLIKKCRNESDGLVNPLLAKAVEILASADVECSKIPQFLENNSTYDYDTKELAVDFAVINEVKDFKAKGFEDDDVLSCQKFLSVGFADRNKVKEFIFNFKDKGVLLEDTIKILDSLKVKTSNDEYDIKEESVSKIFNLKKMLISTRKNEEEERKVAPKCPTCDTYQVDEHTLFVRRERGFDLEDMSEHTPERLKQRYDETIELIENNLLLEFAKSYKDADGLIDDNFLRVAFSLRNAGIVYSSMLDLINLAINKEGKISQSNIEAIKQLKGSKALSSDIAGIIKKCPKNDDGSIHLESLNTLSDLSSVGFDSKDAFKLLYEIKRYPELKDFIVNAGSMFDDKANVFELIPLTKDKMGKVDENSTDVILTLASNFVENYPQVTEKKVLKEITSVMESVKNPFTGAVGDDAAGICSILSKNKFNINSIKNVLYGCEETKGVYNTRLSEIVWKMALEEATVFEITDVLAKCRKHDRTLMADRVQVIMQLFEQGYKKDDIIAFLDKE